MLTKAEKEKRVIDLYEQGKTYREIAHEVHKFFSEISSIIKRYTGEVLKPQANREQQQPPKTIDTKAFTLFEADSTPVQVAIELDVKSEEVTTI